ncbi:MAG: tetratricopeptide repeat protein [Bradymonadaceae bacterium]
MATVEEGWQALNRGNYDQAEQVFSGQLRSNPNSVPALTGLGRTLVLRGRHAEAQTVVQQAMSLGQTPELDALMGEIAGRQGRREEAERLLNRAVSRRPEVAYYWAVLAEQRLRQGRWKEGTDTYLRALSDDADGRAFRQLQELLTDMVDAVIAGRIPENDALRFVNQLDYTIPNRTPQMSPFFGLARRSINSRQAMPRLDSNSTSPQPGSNPPRAPQIQQNQPQNNRAQQSQPRQGPTRSSNRQNRNETARPVRPVAPPSRTQIPASTKSANRQHQARQSQAQRELRAQAGAVRMVELLQQERVLNEALQDNVPKAIPPIWPSLAQNPIDEVPPIQLSPKNILGNQSGIRTNDFRITAGDIVVEIVLERCLHNLIAATAATKASTLTFTPEEILRMELSCRDGLFDHMPGLEGLYREEVSVENQRLIAFGEFMGDCLVRTFGAVWRYDHPPQESTLFLGNQVLKPFELLQRWFTDPEDVHLETIIDEAREALSKSSAMPNFMDYIDPTPGLEGPALKSMLAELWTSYRFSLPETAYTDIAASIEIVHQTPEYVLFKVSKDWVPDFGLGQKGAAIDKEGKVAMGYVRKSGQFLLLGSRKHFAQFAGLNLKELTQANATETLQLVQQCFCPSWRMISSQTMAQEASSRLGNAEIVTPKLRPQRRGPQGDGAILEAWAIAGRAAVKIRLSYTPDETVSWSLQIG